jgi:hypothetical protein
MAWTCGLGCTEPVDDPEEHLRLHHPAEYGTGPERWPDGKVVVHDDTLEPGEFGRG